MESNLRPLNQKKILTVDLFFETFPMLGNDNRSQVRPLNIFRKDFFSKEENVLFIHSGGSPALYVYMEEILDK
jgi:hypothetical protein